MADTSNPQVIIIINVGAGDGEDGDVTCGSGIGSSGTMSGSKRIKAFIKQARKAVGFMSIGTSAIQLINYSTSRVGLETGNYQLQRNINNFKQGASLIGGAGLSLAMGGLTGLAAYGISLGVREMMYQDAFAYEKRMNDIALTAFRERAATYNRSRTLDQ